MTRFRNGVLSRVLAAVFLTAAVMAPLWACACLPDAHGCCRGARASVESASRAEGGHDCCGGGAEAPESAGLPSGCAVAPGGAQDGGQGCVCRHDAPEYARLIPDAGTSEKGSSPVAPGVVDAVLALAEPASASITGSAPVLPSSRPLFLSQCALLL
ncbi:MAG TPA: hypothetical protein PKI11_06865 [Candidatus Hydrogenedentes bacterium]|nr:hypothetical protein [Candidatus Hydrogenedentota bacterium]